MKSWLEKSEIEMYSTLNNGKSVVAERFIRTLKNKIYKYLASISKNIYIKMKPVNVKPSIYIDFYKENNNKAPNFKVADHVTISKYKSVFAKGYFQIGLKKFL